MQRMTSARGKAGLGIGFLAALGFVACGGATSPTLSAAPALSFSSSVKVGGLCCLLSSPQVAVDGDQVFVAWSEAIRYTTYTPVRRSTDGGASFPDPLSFGDWTSGDQDQMRLAVAPGLALNLVWEDTRGGTCDPFCRGSAIFTTRSLDGGARFSPNQPIAAAAPNAEQNAPVLAVASNGDLFVAWQERSSSGSEVRFARRLVGGTGDEPSVRADGSESSSRDQSFPAIALEPDGRIAVAWLDGRSGRPEVFLARSADRGAGFGVGARLHPSDAQVTDRASVRLAATASGRLLAVWAEQRDRHWQVQLSVSLDGGQSFTTPRPVESGSLVGDQSFPSLAVHGPDAVYVGWQDGRSGADRLRVARSSDGGERFEPSVPVDDSGAAQGTQRQPALAVDERGNLLATWLDFSKPDSGVYFAQSGR